MQNSKNRMQTLHWSIDLPIRHAGFTKDEWLVLMVGVCPGVWFVSSSRIFWGIASILSCFFLCILLKRFKKTCGQFRVKSWLMANGWIARPKGWPQYHEKRIGR